MSAQPLTVDVTAELLGTALKAALGAFSALADAWDTHCQALNAARMEVGEAAKEDLAAVSGEPGK